MKPLNERQNLEPAEKKIEYTSETEGRSSTTSKPKSTGNKILTPADDPMGKTLVATAAASTSKSSSNSISPSSNIRSHRSSNTRRQHHLLVVAQMEFLEEMEVGMKCKVAFRFPLLNLTGREKAL
uniref:HDC10342 n=1 Tax=Drosophila melanogaster TaxID=7227 RepID=Q6IL52_DROME|nr:TPA_inf: HDC10342 [Drosophila melanogaster]